MPSPPNALSVISAATTPSAVLTDQLASSLVSVLTTRRGVGLTPMSWEHAAEARAALNAIITDPEHGVAALSSAQTMSNLLKDLLPDAPGEKSILLAAAEAGLANTLRQHVDQGMDPNTAIRLTASSFSPTTPFTPEACTWVPNEIATALGLRHSGGGPVVGGPVVGGPVAGTPPGFDAGEQGMPTQAAPIPGYTPRPQPVQGIGATPGQGGPEAGGQATAPGSWQGPRGPTGGYGPPGFRPPAGYGQPGYRPPGPRPPGHGQPASYGQPGYGQPGYGQPGGAGWQGGGYRQGPGQPGGD